MEGCLSPQNLRGSCSFCLLLSPHISSWAACSCFLSPLLSHFPTTPLWLRDSPDTHFPPLLSVCHPGMRILGMPQAHAALAAMFPSPSTQVLRHLCDTKGHLQLFILNRSRAYVCVHVLLLFLSPSPHFPSFAFAFQYDHFQNPILFLTMDPISFLTSPHFH